MTRMVEVARFADVYEAELAASFLASHGVQSFVADRFLATQYPLLQNALGGARILAPSDQSETASDLLVRARRGEFSEPSEEAPSIPRGTVFPVITAIAAFTLGGYAGRPFLGDRKGLSALQLTGLALLGAAILALGFVLIASFFKDARHWN